MGEMGEMGRMVHLLMGAKFGLLCALFESFYESLYGWTATLSPADSLSATARKPRGYPARAASGSAKQTRPR